MLGSELVQHGLEGAGADLVGLVELRDVVDYRRFIRRQCRQSPFIAYGVHQGIAYPLLAGRRGVGIPNILAVHGSGGGYNRQLQGLFGEGALEPQIAGQAGPAPRHLRAVDGYGSGPAGDHTASFGGEFIKGLLELGGNLVSGHIW